MLRVKRKPIAALQGLMDHVQKHLRMLKAMDHWGLGRFNSSHGWRKVKQDHSTLLGRQRGR